ncbi:putative redox protein [Flavobacterium fontis]|uniref:Putative redox protein n=1 Tax=Flavobacterium fontis TaxID=1124188 RepID=A0A1M5F167_9FLAO|nr:OsmC family protein [Flavobacterium fontis]SHF85275.1 putative redox protein [Flavobacterium fontis]
MKKLLENDIIGSIGTQLYRCTIQWRNGQLVMDEPESLGGQDLGPDPYTTLLASLAGCTLSTLRMYIDRKGWAIPEFSVTLNMEQEQTPALVTHISRTITFPESVEAAIQQRLLVIAEKCPVSKILENNIVIHTKTT